MAPMKRKASGNEENPYHRYDYEGLAQQFPQLNKVLKLSRTSKARFLDWTDRQAVKTLMMCCLQRDFGVRILAEEGSLAPALALKMNYLLWIKDMAVLNNVPNEHVAGVDIGAGGNLYFGLMAASPMRFGWTMIATESDPEAFKAASQNLELNTHLKDKISLIFNEQSGTIFSDEMFSCGQKKKLLFSMCNPPFYDKIENNDKEQVGKEAAGKECEMRFAGGEAAFISSMIKESVSRREQISIFSTLVGHKKSLTALQQQLDALNPGPSCSVINEFCQGRTMRWCLAWTFMSHIQLKRSAPVLDAKKMRKLASPFEMQVPSAQPEDFAARLRSLFRELELVINDHEPASALQFSVSARQPSWRNQRAKRRAAAKSSSVGQPPQDQQDPATSSGPSTKDPYILQMQVCIGPMENKESGTVLQLTFIEGSLGKAGVYEVLQFIRNALKKDPT